MPLYLFDNMKYSDDEMDRYIKSMNDNLEKPSAFQGWVNAFKESFVRSPGPSAFRHGEYQAAMTVPSETLFPDEWSKRSVFYERLTLTLDEPDEKFRRLSEEEWRNSEYYMPELEYQKGMTVGAAKLLSDRKRAELKRKEIIEKSELGTIGNLSAGFFGQLIDPTNIAMSFMPAIGEARFAAWAEKFGVTGARALRGGIEGAAGAIAAEPLVYVASKEEQAEYGLMDSVQNLVFGSMLGAGFHTTFGKMGDIWKKTKGRPSKALEAERAIDSDRYERAERAAQTERDLGINNTSQDTKDEMLKSAAAQMQRGEEVDVAHMAEWDANESGAWEAARVQRELFGVWDANESFAEAGAWEEVRAERQAMVEEGKPSRPSLLEQLREEAGAAIERQAEAEAEEGKPSRPSLLEKARAMAERQAKEGEGRLPREKAVMPHIDPEKAIAMAKRQTEMLNRNEARLQAWIEATEDMEPIEAIEELVDDIDVEDGYFLDTWFGDLGEARPRKIRALNRQQAEDLINTIKQRLEDRANNRGIFASNREEIKREAIKNASEYRKTRTEDMQMEDNLRTRAERAEISRSAEAIDESVLGILDEIDMEVFGNDVHEISREFNFIDTRRNALKEFVNNVMVRCGGKF